MKIETVAENWFEIISSIRGLKAQNGIKTSLPYIVMDVTPEKIDELCLFDKSLIDMMKYMCKVDEIVFRDSTEKPHIYFTFSSYKNFHDKSKWVDYGDDVIVAD